MADLTYTLLSDGSSDQALLPLLTWLLRQQGISYAIQSQWADLRRIRPKPPKKLNERIPYAVDLYPCDLLFIHRDAENVAYEERVREITNVLQSIIPHPPSVCVVPVRMQEAWLLFNEKAIRRAAGNPNGNNFLELPTLEKAEALPNPKEILYDLILQATGLRPGRRKKFKVKEGVHRVAEFINDFSPLRSLSAFANLEASIDDLLQSQKWR